MSERPYARLYHEVMDDPKFDGIREDVRLFGSWALLLLVADMSYPAPAFVPPTVPKTALRRLIEATLVDELPGHRFRIHGLESERTRRSSAARVGGLASGRSRAVEQPLNGRSLHTRTETNLDETRRDETSTSIAREGLPHVTPQVLAVWSAASGRTLLGSGQFAQDTIDDICRRHPEQAIVNAIRRSRAGFEVAPSAQQLAAAVRNTLDPFPAAASSKALEAEQREKADRDASRRRVEATKRRVHDMGGHAEVDPACPSCQAVVA